MSITQKWCLRTFSPSRISKVNDECSFSVVFLDRFHFDTFHQELHTSPLSLRHSVCSQILAK